MLPQLALHSDLLSCTYELKPRPEISFPFAFFEVFIRSYHTFSGHLNAHRKPNQLLFSSAYL